MNKALQLIKNNPVIFTILIIAFLIRFAGIFHDLPYSYYPDEEHFVNRAVSFGSGDLNPHWFHKPAFLMYLLFFEYGLYFAIGKVLGLFQSVDDFALSFFQSKGPFLLIGRVTVTLFGVATVYLTYLVGKEFRDKNTGLIASLFMAFILGHVASSQDIKADVPTAFFTIVSFLFALRIFTTGRPKYYLLSGIFAGLGMATKYYSGPLILTIFISHLCYLKKERLSVIKNAVNWQIIASVAGMFAAFFIASPYNIIDPLGLEGTFIKPLRKLIDFGGHSSTESLRFVGVEVQRFVLIRSLGHYLSVITSDKGMGEIGYIALLGMLIALVKFSMRNVILLSFPIVFILIANRTSPFYTEPRHLNAIFPFMAVFGAYFINGALEKTRVNKEGLIAALLCLLIIYMPANRAVKHNYWMSRPDTRTAAKDWIEENIPAGTKILVEEESAKISPSKNYYMELIQKAKKSKKSQFTHQATTQYEYEIKALPRITYDISYIRFPWWHDKEKNTGLYYAHTDHDKDMGNPLKPVGALPYESYREKGYEYAIVTSRKYVSFLKEDSKSSKKFPSIHRFYKDLFENGELVMEIYPGRSKMRGYVIKVFRVK